MQKQIYLESLISKVKSESNKNLSNNDLDFYLELYENPLMINKDVVTSLNELKQIKDKIIF